jgi:hypothetical protein
MPDTLCEEEHRQRIVSNVNIEVSARCVDIFQHVVCCVFVLL